MPRPFDSRVQRGYGEELQMLGRMRTALSLDDRFSAEEYTRVCEAIDVIVSAIRIYRKPADETPEVTRMSVRRGK